MYVENDAKKKKSARERFRFTRHPEELRAVQRLTSVAPRRRPFRSVACGRAARYLVRTATTDDRGRRQPNWHDGTGDAKRVARGERTGGRTDGRTVATTATAAAAAVAGSVVVLTVRGRSDRRRHEHHRRARFSAGLLRSRAFFPGQSSARWAAAARGLPPPREKTLPPSRGHRTSFFPSYPHFHTRRNGPPRPTMDFVVKGVPDYLISPMSFRFSLPRGRDTVLTRPRCDFRLVGRTSRLISADVLFIICDEKFRMVGGVKYE